MNIGPIELAIIAGAVACIGIVAAGAIVAVIYFMNNRRSGDGPG